MQSFKIFVVLLFFINPVMVEARPVSYPGGWTAMGQVTEEEYSLHTHYSPMAKYSIGMRNELFHKDDIQMHSMQLNYLVKRWNNRDSQANFYSKNGVGFAKDNSDSSVSGFTGLALDWETRRYFTSYENRYIHAGDVMTKFSQSARLGVAPYIGNFGDIHTWMMVQVDHEPKNLDNDHYRVTPLIRLFYDTHLLETGYSDNDQLMINYVRRF
jgi:hypothetical protein